EVEADVEEGRIPLHSPGFQEILKNRRNIKQAVQGKGLLAYLLEDLWKLVPYARSTRTIEGKFFFLAFRVSNNGVDAYATALQKRTLQPLLEILRQIGQRGWMHLPKPEYNLLALLR